MLVDLYYLLRISDSDIFLPEKQVVLDVTIVITY